VHDYHLLPIGAAYRDSCSVLTALREPAASAFRENYRSADTRQAVLEAPASMAYTDRVYGREDWAGASLECGISQRGPAPVLAVAAC